MKSKATQSYCHVSSICDCKDSIVAILVAIDHAFQRKEHKNEIRKSVDDLGGIYSGVIVLGVVSL